MKFRDAISQYKNTIRNLKQQIATEATLLDSDVSFDPVREILTISLDGITLDRVIRIRDILGVDNTQVVIEHGVEIKFHCKHGDYPQI